MSYHINPYRSGKLTVGASGTAECIQMSNVVSFFSLRAVLSQSFSSSRSWTKQKTRSFLKWVGITTWMIKYQQQQCKTPAAWYPPLALKKDSSKSSPASPSASPRPEVERLSDLFQDKAEDKSEEFHGPSEQLGLHKSRRVYTSRWP